MMIKKNKKWILGITAVLLISLGLGLGLGLGLKKPNNKALKQELRATKKLLVTQKKLFTDEKKLLVAEKTKNSNAHAKILKLTKLKAQAESNEETVKNSLIRIGNELRIEIRRADENHLLATRNDQARKLAEKELANLKAKTKKLVPPESHIDWKELAGRKEKLKDYTYLENQRLSKLVKKYEDDAQKYEDDIKNLKLDSATNKAEAESVNEMWQAEREKNKWLEKNQRELVDQTAILQGEVSDLNKEIEKLELEIELKNIELIENLKNEQNLAREADWIIERLTARVKKLKTKKEKLKAQIQKIAKGEEADYLEEVSQLESDKDQLKAEKDALSYANKQQGKIIESKIEKIKQLEKTQDLLQNFVLQLGSELQEKREENKKYEDDLKRLKLDSTTNKAEADSANEMLADEKAKNKRLEKNQRELVDKVAILQGEVSDLNKEIKKLEAKIELKNKLLIESAKNERNLRQVANRKTKRLERLEGEIKELKKPKENEKSNKLLKKTTPASNSNNPPKSSDSKDEVQTTSVKCSEAGCSGEKARGDSSKREIERKKWPNVGGKGKSSFESDVSLTTQPIPSDIVKESSKREEVEDLDTENDDTL